MKEIWKFPLKAVEAQSVKMPVDAKILTIQEQFEEPMMWCLVEPNKTKAYREIRIAGTGYEIKEPFTEIYISTFQSSDGNYILHAFDQGYK